MSARRIFIALVIALSSAAVLAGCSSCKQLGDCDGQCIAPTIGSSECISGEASSEGRPTECAPNCAADAGCADGLQCVTRCVVLSIGDNYDFVELQKQQVCLPRSQTDGGL
jgi:hypothetical protein